MAPAYGQNWKVGYEGVTCYNQEHERLDNVAGMTCLGASIGVGKTKHRQPFYGYRGWPAKVAPNNQGWIVTMCGGGVVWLLRSTVYVHRKTDKPAHTDPQKVTALLRQLVETGPPPPLEDVVEEPPSDEHAEE
jgi:hypothetical protein